MIMEYEKLYKDALERARTIVDNKNASSVWKDWLRNTFPELKESEDERVRKWIIENIQETLDIDGFFEGQKIMAKNAIAWLEKQGEQKPTDKVEPKFKKE